MSPICDFCRGPLGDHDRPYRYGAQLVELKLRFTADELKVLIEFRRHVDDVRYGGYRAGRGFGDISTDDPVCHVCGRACHDHDPVGLCA